MWRQLPVHSSLWCSETLIMDAYVPLQQTHTLENFHYVPVVQTRSSSYKPNCSYWTFLTSRFDLMTRRRTYRKTQRRDVPSNPTLMNSAELLFCWCHVALINAEMLTRSVPPSQKTRCHKNRCVAAPAFFVYSCCPRRISGATAARSFSTCETFWDGSAAHCVSMKLLKV